MKTTINIRPRTSPLSIWKFVGEAQVRWYFQTDKRKYGDWFRHRITDLGPAFIKLGQFLSTRQDILGKEVVTELTKLQDDIKPTSYNEIIQTIEDKLGKPWTEVFVYIDNNSLASASIGQVHLAKLKTGEDVVIKVQKPFVAKQIREDLETLRNMNNIFSKTGSARSAEIENILSEYSRFLNHELDYKKEVEYMEKFRDVMDGLPVYIPKVYTNLSNENMIVMEYVPSIKITNIDEMKKNNIDTVRIAQNLMQIFIYQIIYTGLVHCDPHPGNIGVLSDGDTLVLYDFGNVIDLSPDFRKEINHLVYSIVTKDVDEFVELLQKLQILEIRDQLDILQVKEFFRFFFSYLENLDFNELKDSILKQSVQTDVQLKVQINPDFLSLFRVFSLLDGTCAKLDPNFNYIEVLKPYTEEMMKDIRFWDNRVRKDVNKLRSYPSYIRNTDNNIIRMQNKLNRFQNLFTQFQLIMILWIWFDHPTDWQPIAVSILIVLWMQLQKTI